MRLFGWQLVGEIPATPNNYVIVGGRHTAKRDFLVVLAATLQLKIRPLILIKKEAFLPVIGRGLSALGALPVDRNNPGALVDNIVHQFAHSNTFSVVLAPQGSRSSKTLKSGFFRIAQGANVPIITVTIHADRKQLVFHPAIVANDQQQVIAQVEALFATSIGFNDIASTASRKSK